MRTISVDELKNDLDKYLIVGQAEKIQVTQNSKIIFIIVPKNECLTSEWDNIFGVLPESAFDDKNIDRE